MAVKKTKKTVKKTTKKNLVEEKLNQMVDDTKSSSSEVSKGKSVKKPFPWWVLSTMILLVLFIGMLLFQYNKDFRTNLTGMMNAVGLSKTETPTTTKREPFVMGMTIVYNQSDATQKSTLENYLGNVERNLDNTKVDAKWVDKDSAEGKKIIDQTEAKYLPVLTTDESITKHPQYSMFAPAISIKDGLYVFQSEGMEYLKRPEIGDARVQGADPATAKVVIIEYASMTCHYCQQMHPILENILKKYGNQVALVTKNYDRGSIDSILEQSVECAADQGKFSQMVGNLYEKQNDLFTALQKGTGAEDAIYAIIKQTASNSGANGEKVLACVKEGKYAEKVARQTKEGQEFGVMGTPSFFVNEKFIGGAMEEANFTALIEQEINKK
ncbi:thioredoxin domain-containing protein [Candidatus Peregrinibacteria bacterium]|nr:thioredoxin domain-containing protein [Candidatus Peregrinibacteria bacterium]